MAVWETKTFVMRNVEKAMLDSNGYEVLRLILSCLIFVPIKLNKTKKKKTDELWRKGNVRKSAVIKTQ